MRRRGAIQLRPGAKLQVAAPAPAPQAVAEVAQATTESALRDTFGLAVVRPKAETLLSALLSTQRELAANEHVNTLRLVIPQLREAPLSAEVVDQYNYSYLALYRYIIDQDVELNLRSTFEQIHPAVLMTDEHINRIVRRLKQLTQETGALSGQTLGIFYQIFALVGYLGPQEIISRIESPQANLAAILFDNPTMSIAAHRYALEISYERLKDRAPTESTYRCDNCRSNRVQLRSVQARSNDEPATIILNCMACGRSWRAQ